MSALEENRKSEYKTVKKWGVWQREREQQSRAPLTPGGSGKARSQEYHFIINRGKIPSN